MKTFDLSVLFFLQLFVILLACRVVGWGVKFLGQPQVVGEMIAGVLLGPSLFGLSGTTLGTLALAAGALDDVAAWCLLAIVISSTDQSWQAAVFAIGGGAIYATVKFGFVRPALAWLEKRWMGKENASSPLPASVLVSILALVMLSPFITDECTRANGAHHAQYW